MSSDVLRILGSKINPINIFKDILSCNIGAKVSWVVIFIAHSTLTFELNMTIVLLLRWKSVKYLHLKL